MGQSPKPRSAPVGRRKEGRPQAGRREEKRREEEFSSPAFARPLARSPLVSLVSSRPWKRAALQRRAMRPLAMGSPAHRPALLLLLLPLQLLLLRVPPSRGFPGRIGGVTASSAGHQRPPESPLGPFARDSGRCRGRPLFAQNSSFAARGWG